MQRPPRSVIFADCDLLVPMEAPETERRPWNPKTPSLRKNVHIGQLKLLGSEIAFLTLGITEDPADCVILYAGAAGGHHIPALASLFPDTKFYLYDPAPFAIEPTDQLSIVRGMFTDDVARDWGSRADTRILFISDVRTSGDTAEEHESEVQENMAMQARWVELLQPNLVNFSLKFRIPYTIIEANLPFYYLNGILLYQPWPKRDSMELRLIGDAVDAKAGSSAVLYDAKRLEETVFYHNSVVRPDGERFANVFTQSNKPYDDPQFDNGYDCTFFLHCLKRHVAREAEVLALARQLIRVTSQGRWTLMQRKAQRAR